MKTQKLSIAQIKASKYNPRKDLKPGDPEFEKLKNSIERWDLVEPLVVNKRTGVLVSGHQRLKVCKALGLESVEAVIVDLPPDREKLLNMSLNKNGSDWDYLKLEELFREFDLGELNITGFDDDEIKKIATLMDDTSDVAFSNPSQTPSVSGSVSGYEERGGGAGNGITVRVGSNTAFEPHVSADDGAETDADNEETASDDKFVVYISFGSKDAADNWLAQEGFDVKFDNREMVHIYMSGEDNEN